MPTRCNRGFYCRSYCLLNMFRAPLCPSSGTQEYYTAVAACGISCCGFQVGLVWTWGLCVRFAGCCFKQTNNLKTTAPNTTGNNHCIIIWSSWCWAWCFSKHVEQAIRSAIKDSVASSWHFISTYYHYTILSKSLILFSKSSSFSVLCRQPHSLLKWTDYYRLQCSLKGITTLPFLPCWRNNTTFRKLGLGPSVWEKAGGHKPKPTCSVLR